MTRVPTRAFAPIAVLLAASISTEAAAQPVSVPPPWTLDSLVDPMSDRKIMKAGLFSAAGAPMQLTLSCTEPGVVLFFEGLEPILPSERYGPGFLVRIRYRLGRAQAVTAKALFTPGARKVLGLSSATPPVTSEGALVRGMAAGAVILWLEYPTLGGTRTSRFDVPAGSASIIRHVYRSCGARAPT